MPFNSTSQMRAAFGGYLGKTMKDKAETWAEETPDIKSLPKHVAQTHVRAAVMQRLRGKK
jgi:hypothetical protein